LFIEGGELRRAGAVHWASRSKGLIFI